VSLSLYPEQRDRFPLLLVPVPDYIFIPITISMAFIALLSAGQILKS
jgi:hypothetical protein